MLQANLSTKNMTKKMLRMALALIVFVLPFVPSSSAAGQDTSPPIKALILTGQNSHNWKVSSAALKQMLEDTGLFQVDVAVSPPSGSSMKSFRPDFSSVKVVILDYSGDPWPETTQKEFVAYVKNGGGVVVYHAANNAFPEWPEYNEITGLGGWENRDEKSGPYVFWKDGRVVENKGPGIAGQHGALHAFLVINRDTGHPVTAGLPPKWMHARDELYGLLRGPARNLHVLATAFSDPAQGGTGRDEPVLFTISYGAGRVFHTVLGHAGGEGPQPALECAGFIVTFQRGAEWAATGRVTQKIPGDFPATDLDKPAPADVRQWPGYRRPSLEAILKDFSSFEYSRDETALYRLREYILTHMNSPESRAALEEMLVAYVESPQSNLAAKLAVCRQLRLIGSDKSVPALAKMLLQDDTTDMARYALEKIPGEAAEQALREALSKTEGPAKIGLISSLAQRKSMASVNDLAVLLDDQDTAVSSAAATALSSIGGPEAAEALAAAFDKAGEKTKNGVAACLLRCAEDLLASGNPGAAARLYEKVLSAPASELQTVLRKAAFKGKIASSGKEEAERLILDTLTRAPQEMHSPAIRMIPKVFDASGIAPVCALSAKLPETSQVEILSVLSDYPKEFVLPSFVDAVHSPAAAVRIAALRALAKVGDASTVVLLAERAAASRGEEQDAARASLASLRGKDVDDAVLFGLVSFPSESVKFELIKAAAERRIRSGKALIIRQVRSPSRRNRIEAIKTLIVIASAEDLPDLLSILLRMEDEFEQEEMSNAIARVARTIPDPYSRAQPVTGLLEPQPKTGRVKVTEPAKRAILYRTLGKIGDDSFLRLLRAAVKDENPGIQDAAVRALADWPNISAREDVLAIARNSPVLVHRVLAFQAYVRMIGLEPYQAPEGAVLKLQEILALASRPQEKKLVLGILPNFACPQAVQLASSLLVDEAVSKEALAAIHMLIFPIIF